MDPQAGEPGPCIVRARGARGHGKDAPPSSLLTGAFSPLAPSLRRDDTLARERNLKTSQLEGGIYLFGGCSTGLPGRGRMHIFPRLPPRRIAGCLEGAELDAARAEWHASVCYDPPPMNTPVREGETIEGSRTTRNRPYPVLKCSSAQVLPHPAHSAEEKKKTAKRRPKW